MDSRTRTAVSVLRRAAASVRMFSPRVRHPYPRGAGLPLSTHPPHTLRDRTTPGVLFAVCVQLVVGSHEGGSDDPPTRLDVLSMMSLALHWTSAVSTALLQRMSGATYA